MLVDRSLETEVLNAVPDQQGCCHLSVSLVQTRPASSLPLPKISSGEEGWGVKSLWLVGILASLMRSLLGYGLVRQQLHNEAYQVLWHCVASY